jgi:hypothetical protein
MRLGEILPKDRFMPGTVGFVFIDDPVLRIFFAILKLLWFIKLMPTLKRIFGFLPTILKNLAKVEKYFNWFPPIPKKGKSYFLVLEKNFEKITFVIAKRENHYFSRLP